MLIKYDRLEDFVKKLEMLDKNLEVFVSIAKDVTEIGTVKPSITIQVLDGDRVYTHFYDALPEFQVIPNSTLSALPNAEESKKIYADSMDKFENRITEEYNKFITLLRDQNKFVNIVEYATIL